MVPQQPFPIYDVKLGLALAKQPWLSPEVAWRELRNCYPYRGRVIRRAGYKPFGELGYEVSEATGDGNAKGTSGAPYSDTLLNTPIIAAKGTYKVTIEDTTAHTGANAVVDDGNGVLTHTGDGDVGTINYETGAIYVNGLSVAFDSNVTVDYEYRKTASNAVMGIDSYFSNDGNETLLAFDRYRYWKYNTTDDRFEPPSAVTADIFSGDDSQFFWAEQAQGKLFVTNGEDPICYYDGSNLFEMNTDWDDPTQDPPDPETGFTGGGGSYARDISSAEIAIFYKNRLVLLHTVESATRHAQRARWSEVDPLFQQTYSGGDVFPWAAESYADAPTTDWIVSAAFLGDDLIVFFERSVWRLAWTDDFRSPFIWEQIASTDGSYAKMGTVDFTDELLTMGPTNIVATDARDVYNADDPIPDRVLDMNVAALPYSVGIIADEVRLVMWTFADAADEKPNSILINQFEDNAWAEWELPFHLLGYYEFAEGILWDDTTGQWQTLDVPFDERSAQAGFPAVLAGDRECQIFILFTGQDDDGLPFEMKMLSQRLNPFTKQGGAGVSKVRLGKVDILAEAADGTTLRVRFFKDFGGAHYLEKTVDLSPENVDDEKVKRRILVNRVAGWHQIEITNTGSDHIAIDAVIPWFEPAGELRNL